MQSAQWPPSSRCASHLHYPPAGSCSAAFIDPGSSQFREPTGGLVTMNPMSNELPSGAARQAAMLNRRSVDPPATGATLLIGPRSTSGVYYLPAISLPSARCAYSAHSSVPGPIAKPGTGGDCENCNTWGGDWRPSDKYRTARATWRRPAPRCTISASICHNSVIGSKPQSSKDGCRFDSYYPHQQPT